jgi:2-dehydro-3-deoxyphosphogluconate aldolase/(4S)-4-hydroxy-2-oxoglutarate aldolase
MIDRARAVAKLCDKGVVAVVRAESSEQLIDVAEALHAGGVDCIEITMTTPDALEVISRCRSAMGDRALIGVGSVLEGTTARRAISAGAQYVVSPIFHPDVLVAAHGAGVPCVPGAMTPTEIQAASAAGADLVKVFPGGRLGPRFLRDVLAPMPHLRLTPTGGVDLDTAAEWIRCGACTLGVGSALVDKRAVSSGEMDTIRDLAARFVGIVADARAELAG